MFVYFNKKVSMPGGTRLRSLAWNSQQGWLACGGDNGLLKVLKLPGPGTVNSNNEIEVKRDPFAAAQSNLTMNQTLEGHQGSVVVVRWNENYRKLTSSDDRGLIIVWILHKGMWFEEMVNNRCKSVVQDIKWSGDGQKVCIVYEDGQVIVGNVDGQRIWGRDLNAKLANIEWSPDGRLLIFGTRDGMCNIHDYLGNFLSTLSICFESKTEISSVVGIDWFNKVDGYDSCAPTLALALHSGKIQMMRHELDEEPVLIDTKMMITSIKWSPNGEVLGVVGTEKRESQDSIESHPTVQLYSHNGIHLRTLQVPGKKISTLAWEGGGLKLALAVDSYIYLANIRPEYKWTFFNGSICVYGFQKKGCEEYSIVFWDVTSEKKSSQTIKSLIGICGNEEYCMLAATGDEPETYSLYVCNSFGQHVASKLTTVEPQFISMNERFIFVSSESLVFMWDYQSCLHGSSDDKSPRVTSMPNKDDHGKTFCLDSLLGLAPIEEKSQGVKDNEDQISCICSSKNYLMVGRDSGILHRFALPNITLESTDLLQCRPQAMELNSNSTRLAVIDMNGILKLYEVKSMTQQKSKETGEGIIHLDFERKDVWNMKWAGDNPDLLAVMEKSRMYIVRGIELEEPVPCTAYLCSFRALQIQAVQLDEIMQKPESPGKDHLFYYETKSQRDTQQILKATDLQDAFSYIEEHSHPRLWMMLAEHALQKLDFSIAEKAFVKCQNYFGIQFVKHCHSLKQKNEQKAEVAAYFKKFDEAEKLLLQTKRIDLALELHMKFGRWFALEKLVIANLADKSMMKLTYDSIGKFYMEKQNYKEAKKFYERSKNNACIATCLYKLCDWKNLERLSRLLNKEDPILIQIANYFWTVGMCEQAVVAFIQHGSILSAIECCMELSNWKMAFELEQKHNQDGGVKDKFNQYVQYLTKCGNHSLAIKAATTVEQHVQVVVLLIKFAKKLVTEGAGYQTLKKVYVLMALKIEKCKSINMKLKVEDPNINSMLEKPWHYAEAYHFWCLAHQHLYLNNFQDAFQVSLWLEEYQDVLGAQSVLSLIALVSYFAQRYKECHKAFTSLDNNKAISSDIRQKLAKISLSIFSKHNLQESSRKHEYTCNNCTSAIEMKDRRCSSCYKEFHICFGTGLLMVEDDCLNCDACKHHIKASLANDYEYCPFCHGDLRNSKRIKGANSSLKMQKRKQVK